MLGRVWTQEELMIRKSALLVPAAVLTAALIPVPAHATPPVGVCPDGYAMLTKAEVGQLPDADLALAVFDVVNANGDEFVCYKQYPNPPHHGGHYGNFTDNTANPAAQQE